MDIFGRIQIGDVEGVQLLLATSNEAMVNTCNGKDFSPLLWAIKYDQAEIVSLLLACKQIDVNKLWGTLHLYTPLTWAICADKDKIAGLLLRDPRTDITFGKGTTDSALYVSVSHKSTIAQALIRCPWRKNYPAAMFSE